MKQILVILFSVLSLVCAFAQKPAGDPRGGISADMLRALSTAYEGSASDKALHNALNSTPINTLAVSAERAAMFDTHFSDEVVTKGRHDPCIA